MAQGRERREGLREPVRGVDHRGGAPVRPHGLLAAPALQVYHLQAGLTLGYYAEQRGSSLPRLSAPKCETDVEVRHGDAVGSLQAVHTPGHTDGSMSFYWPAQRALFTGDVLVTWPKLEIGWRGLSTDMDRNRRSLAELATSATSSGSAPATHPDHDAADTVRRLLLGA